jgi:hypothetical protein
LWEVVFDNDDVAAVIECRSVYSPRRLQVPNAMMSGRIIEQAREIARES